MEFHSDKCQVLRVTNKKSANIITHDYILHGQTLSVVSEVKYLGLTLSDDLKWDKHIGKAISEANSTMAVLRRNVRNVSPQTVKATAYTALVRPHVEYCSAVWDPYTNRLKQRVKMVQRHAARWVGSKYRRGPNWTGELEIINPLSWPSLELHRKVARLTLLYKMSYNLVMTLLVCAPRDLRSVSPNASMPVSRIPTRLHQTDSFFPRTVADWNELPYQVGSVSSLEAFKASVMTHLG